MTGPSPSVPVESREQPTITESELDSWIDWYDAHLVQARAERDRARDLAAHLEEQLARMESK